MIGGNVNALHKTPLTITSVPTDLQRLGPRHQLVLAQREFPSRIPIQRWIICPMAVNSSSATHISEMNFVQRTFGRYSSSVFMRVPTQRRRPGGAHLMGEKQDQLAQLSFNISLKGARATGTALLTVAALCFSLPLLAQQEGPLPPAPPREEKIPASPPRTTAPRPAPQTSATPPDSMHFSSGISKEPPALRVDQIIQSFAEREAEFREERDNFTYV